MWGLSQVFHVEIPLGTGDSQLNISGSPEVGMTLTAGMGILGNLATGRRGYVPG